MAEPILTAVTPADTVRQPLLGYAMVWAAAILFAINGSVSKVVLTSGLNPRELTQARSTGAFVGFALVLALVRPRALRLTRSELPFLILFGVTGVAFVQWFYFAAIDRLPVGIALLLQYLAPLLVALWARFAFHEHVRRRLWLALVLALVGLSIVVEFWRGGGDLDSLGVAAGIGGAVAYAVYVLLAERGVRARDPVSLSCYGFLFAAIFWAVLQPIWMFPTQLLGEDVSLQGNLERYDVPLWALLAFIVVVGTMMTFSLIVGSLRYVPATRVGIIAMLEPVVAALVAYLWLRESLGTPELVGGAIVLSGIILAQTAR